MSIFERDVNSRNRLNEKKVYQIVGNLMVQAGTLEFLV